MSKARLHPTVLDFRGAMGPMLFRRRNGKLYASIKSAGSTKPPTDGQLAQRQLFKAAVVFAKSAIADPDLCAFYAPFAKQKELSVFTVALTDFFSKPAMFPPDLSKYQGQVGDTIAIQAQHDLPLAGVEMGILSAAGALIERGNAVESGAGSGKWVYTATSIVAPGTDIVIEATGVDYAGNQVKTTETRRVGG